jgi:2-keto-4-pentenoate hydratase
MISDKDLEEAVAAMLAARGESRPLKRLPPGGARLTLDDAYVIQEAFARECGLAVVGYKIGCASKESQALVGASGPFAARIFAPTCFDSPAEISARDFFTVGVEAEFGFTMRDGLPPRAIPYARAEVARAVAAVSPVIELCDTRLENWKGARIEEIIADNGFHGGLVVGRPVNEWERLDLAAYEVALSMSGALRAKGASAGSLGHPLDGLVWIANELSRRGYGLGKGDIVATGTWTGLHFVREPAMVVADFGTLGRVEVRVRDQGAEGTIINPPRP